MLWALLGVLALALAARVLAAAHGIEVRNGGDANMYELLAGTRRNMPVMPLVMALAGVSAVAGAEWARDRLARRRVPIESVLAPR